ncbi:hypothetical protein EBR03_07895 [bacterium]|nr:hypothetical protein [bacterium]
MDLIIGIDQTGAASQKGKNAKPLPVCVLGLNHDCRWQVVTEFKRKKLQLKTLSPSELEELLTRLEIEVPLKKVGLAVDCVLGLPRKFVKKPPKGRPYLWEVFREAAEFNKGGKEFGRDVAEAFFSKWVATHSKSYPRRTCEKISGSNSLFQSRPYQKNIQTGTFRIWKELGRTPTDWIRIWPFEKMKNPQLQGPWIFEGYPSLLWKEVLKSPNRKPSALKSLVSARFPKLQIDTWKHVQTDPDHADAFVLALGAAALLTQNQLWEPFSHFYNDSDAQSEGWLLGLKSY